jgi:hypothetical protein
MLETLRNQHALRLSSELCSLVSWIAEGGKSLKEKEEKKTKIDQKFELR